MEGHEQGKDQKEPQKRTDAIGLRPRTSLIKPPSYHQIVRAAPKTKRRTISDEKRLIKFRFKATQEPEGEGGKVLSNVKSQQTREMHDQDNVVIVNQDFCSICNGDGLFICCEACPRSFHFACLTPPLDRENPPKDSWYCDQCVYKKKYTLNGGAKGTNEDPLDRLLAKIRDMLPTAIRQQRGSKAQSNNQVRAVKKVTGSARYCHYCRQVHLGRYLLTCAYCPLAWHNECLPSPFILTKPFRCPAHIPDGIITSTPTDPVAPYVLTDKALRMIGYSDAYPKFARVPEFIRMYYDEIKAQTMQTEPCHVGVETD